MKCGILRLDLPCYCLQVVDAKTGQEVTEETEAAGEWIDEYEKFRATEADDWVKELTSAANVRKVQYQFRQLFKCRHHRFN